MLWNPTHSKLLSATVLAACTLALLPAAAAAPARTQKPALHGAHWMAVTGKPLAATAGAMIFERAAMRSMPPAP